MPRPCRTQITHEELTRCLDYNPDTGIFTWKIRKKGTNGIGTEAGCNHIQGYRDICINGVRFLSHRLAWFYMTKEWPYLVDHVNGNKKDNRFSNLRDSNYSSNLCNSKLRKTNSSGIKGVSWFPQTSKWHAQIMLDYKQYHLGYFDCKEDAAEAVRIARDKLHGVFQNHG